MNRILGITLVIAATISQSVIGFASDTQNQLDQELAGLVTTTQMGVQARADEIRQSNVSLRAMNLKVNSLQRQINETENRLKIATTAFSQNGDLYSVSREFVIHKADFLLFACLTSRAVSLMIKPNDTATDEFKSVPKSRLFIESAACPFIDAAVATAVSLTAASESEAVGEVLNGAVRNTPTRFPRAARAIRTGIIAYGAAVITQAALVATYADDISYREGFNHLSKEGFEKEINKQLAIDNDLRKELAALTTAMAQQVK